MKSALKKDFSELLNKIDAIDIGLSANCDDSLDEIFRNLEDQYRRIQRATLPKLEDLKIVSDIIDQYHTCNKNEKYSYASLKPTINKSIGKISNYAFFEMQEKLIPFYLKKAEWLWGEGRITEALDAWEEVLKVNPDNEYIHSKLSGIMNVPQPVKNRAVELHGKYQFKYLGSFGYNIAKYPICIVVSDYDNTLFVSDYVGDEIHRFNPRGEYLGPLSVEVKTPMGLFKDAKNNLWICDFGNKRLLIVDSDGIVLDEISLEEINLKACHPRSVCVTSREIFILVSDRIGDCREIVCLDRFTGGDLGKHLDVNGLEPMICLKTYEDDLYIGVFAPPVICKYTSPQYHFDKCLKPNVPGSLLRFTKVEDSLMISTGRYIAKANADGQIQFSFNMAKFFGTERVMARGLEVTQEKGVRQLLVTDELQMSIHKFLI